MEDDSHDDLRISSILEEADELFSQDDDSVANIEMISSNDQQSHPKEKSIHLRPSIMPIEETKEEDDELKELPTINLRNRNKVIAYKSVSSSSTNLNSSVTPLKLGPPTKRRKRNSKALFDLAKMDKNKVKNRLSDLNVLQRLFPKLFMNTDWHFPQRVKIKTFLECNAIQIIMTFLTIYALYSEDIRIAYTPDPSKDVGFGIIAFFVMLIFFVELALMSYSIENYFLSFFFWLDLIAAVSLIFDVEFIMKDSGLYDGGKEARAGRAARAGTKAGRIVRLIRIIRLTSVFKHCQKDDPKEDAEYDEYEDSKRYEPTKIGEFLSQMMTKKVILAVLTMVVILPYLQAANYDELIGVEQSLQRLDDWTSDSTVSQTQSDLVIDNFITEHNNDNLNKDLIYLKVNGADYLTLEAKANDLRATEIETFDVNTNTEAQFDIKRIRVADAKKSIGSTTFLIFILAVFAMTFTRDTEQYVVTPIRDMTNAIRNLASYEKAMKLMAKPKNSRKRQMSHLIRVKREAQIRARITSLSIQKICELQSSSSPNDLSLRSMSTMELDSSISEEMHEHALETDMMQGTIRKLARLLELGFGVAGKDIIKQIIAGQQCALTRMSAIDFTKTGGNLINAIFGFIIIRDFNTTLQVLQGETMVYVNSIAEIVHSIVHKYNGAANKNIGSAFLCVWKLSEEEHYDEHGVDVDKQNLADQAMLAFIMIIIEIRGNREIQRYAAMPEIKRLMPDFKVSLGFGLHVGWSIEGAIGSRHKIDASYLSPNVNLAARLESGTHQFHVDLLMSDSFVQLLSPTARMFCRQIDCIKVKGSDVPIGIHTYDLIEKSDIQSSNDIELTGIDDEKYGEEIDDNDEDDNIIDGVEIVDSMTKWELVYLRDYHLRNYRKRIKRSFYVVFKKAFKYYIDGKWNEARLELSKCKKLFTNDGPTEVLLEVMRKHNFEAPKDWKGYRSLTSK